VRKTALAADVLHFAVADGSQIGSSNCPPSRAQSHPCRSNLAKFAQLVLRTDLLRIFIKIQTYRENTAAFPTFRSPLKSILQLETDIFAFDALRTFVSQMKDILMLNGKTIKKSLFIRIIIFIWISEVLIIRIKILLLKTIKYYSL